MCVCVRERERERERDKTKPEVFGHISSEAEEKREERGRDERGKPQWKHPSLEQTCSVFTGRYLVSNAAVLLIIHLYTGNKNS